MANIKGALIVFFLLAVIGASAFIIFDNFRLISEKQAIAQIKNPEEKASLLTGQLVEGQILKKLIDIYSQKSKCSAPELISHTNFVNTLSIITGIYLHPVDETEATEVISQSKQCIPQIEKDIFQKQDSIYSVSYNVLFPETCSLPNKRIGVEFEADVELLTAKVVRGMLGQEKRNLLGGNIERLDNFGNCRQEMVFKLAKELGITDLGEEI